MRVDLPKDLAARPVARPSFDEDELRRCADSWEATHDVGDVPFLVPARADDADALCFTLLRLRARDDPVRQAEVGERQVALKAARRVGSYAAGGRDRRAPLC